ncbi:hypothetical protein [Sangeribacter muris]|uniref:hypothetical protein n=1 Tax=Sangeribacter muris TaxID=2880703 RepID=UPI00244E2623|nr:hypothetical protein [Sangeribacter muris]
MVFEDSVNLISILPARHTGIIAAWMTILLFIVAPLNIKMSENILAPRCFVLGR